jgi:hypothetical protein
VGQKSWGLGFLDGISFFGFLFVDAVEFFEEILTALLATVSIPGFVIQVPLPGDFRVLQTFNPTVKLSRNLLRIRYEI